MALRRKPPSRAVGELLFESDEPPLEETLTGFGGLPLFLRTARSLGVGASAGRHRGLKQGRRGLYEAAYVESFLALKALGGECLDDFDVLREDLGMAAMLGYEPPSPEAARKFLYQFHDEEASARAPQQQLERSRASVLPGERAALVGLAAVNRDVGGKLGRRCPDQQIASVDLEATVIASHQREAQPTYQGSTGYQPLLALWAELDVVLADQFRDGNTPAIQEPLAVARRAFEALPETVDERYFRGDSACYENELLDGLRDENRATGPPGRIGFAVSAPLMKPLKDQILQRESYAWQPYRDDAEAAWEGAAVDSYPAAKGRREPLRYLALRVRKRQGALFADGGEVKALRGGDELVGLGAGAFARLAAGEGGLDRGLARRVEERAGGGGVAVRPFRRQRGLAAFERADAQRMDGEEAARLAAGAVAGAAEAAAVFGVRAARQIRAARAAADVAAVARLAPLFQLELGV